MHKMIDGFFRMQLRARSCQCREDRRSPCLSRPILMGAKYQAIGTSAFWMLPRQHCIQRWDGLSLSLPPSQPRVQHIRTHHHIGATGGSGLEGAVRIRVPITFT
jgi:hypothetical protein